MAKRLVQQGEAEIAAYEPPSRTYLCYLISAAKIKLDRPGAHELLLKCMNSSHAIEDKELREQLQSWITKSLLTYGAASVEELLPQVEGRARQSLRAELITHALEKKNYDHAIDLIRAVRPSEEQFPYGPAAEVMQRLPEERSGEKSAIFAQAVSHFKQAPPVKGSFSRDDLGMMVVRFASQLPPSTIMEAVDLLLANAREKQDTNLVFTLSSNDKSATFASLYEYRLFQVLPAVRAVDPDRAEQLLKDDEHMRATFSSYPQGMRDIDPTLRETPPAECEHGNMSMSIRSGKEENSSREEARQRLQQMRRRQANEVVKLAEENPKQAIAMAAALPAGDPDDRRFKCDALLQIARANQKKQPTYTKHAIDELLKNTSGLGYQSENNFLRDAAELLIRMEEDDAAEKVIDRGMELAEKTYEKDKNPADPNLAINPYWPSAAVWKTFISLTGKIAPQKALEAAGEIKDSEIQTFAKASLANTLVGNKGGTTVMEEKRKSGDESYLTY